MINNWLIATYKINEVRIVEDNLLNQSFEYYLPKITIKKINSNPKKEVLFPGYIFVNTSLNNYSALKYTSGIKDIVKFGNSIPYISDEEVKAMQMAEKESEINPMVSRIKIGHDAFIAKGSFRGNVIKICKLSSKKRVGAFITFLGKTRMITIPEKYLTLC